MEALLIIDMQVGPFRLSQRFDRDGVVKRINTLADHFRSTGRMVIFVQHDGTRENYLFPGSEDWQILPELQRREGDYYLEKTANDSFYRTDLDNLLRSRKITEVYITGCATDFCVNATVHSALVRDFDVMIVKDCHTTADRPGQKAEQLIAFHNWLWENLTPTAGRVKVAALHDLI